MSGIHAGLSELGMRRTQLAGELADVDAAIAMLEKLARNGGAPAAVARRAIKRRTPKTPKARGKGRSTPVDQALVDKAKQLWERGDSVSMITKAIGGSPARIYNWSSRFQWKRPTKQKFVQLAARVRCPKCDTMTATDPCDGCGKPVRAAL